MKKILLTRFGGIGDVAPVMVAGKQLKKKGYEVTIALRKDGDLVQCDLLRNTDCFDASLDYIQIGPWSNRCVEYKHGMVNIESTYSKYDEVCDFMNVVENNNTCRSSFLKTPLDIWKKTKNSNWINWYDLHLMWVNINPENVPVEEKRAVFVLNQFENAQVEYLKKKYPFIVAVQTNASSLARTWYQVDEYVKMLVEAYKDALLVVWDNKRNSWMFLKDGNEIKVEIDNFSALRRSMIIIKAARLFVGADSGMSHVAEGLGVENIAIYSTVPAWTRNKYYKNQKTIDPGISNPEYYTFGLLAGDPLRIEEGKQGLSPRELRVLEMYEKHTDIKIVMKELNTDDVGVNMELEALMRKMQSFERIQSKSLSSVSAKQVFDLTKETLND